jgi:acyl-CoA synthetase (AMP-forming)/AMP-acid ligase II
VISRHQRQTLSYSQLDENSNALARGLIKLGVKRGDRCAVSLGNNIEYATLTYALFKLGAVLVPLNPAFTHTQVSSALNHLGASHLILSLETNLPFKAPRDNYELIESIVPNIGSISRGRKLHSEVVPSLESLILVDNSAGRLDLKAFSAAASYQNVFDDGLAAKSIGLPSDLDPHDVVNIQFTSGTTSTPKAACLTHRNILNNGKSIGDRMLLTPKDVICCPPPLFHCFGCILGYMATATHGAAIAFPTESFDPVATLKTCQEYSCTGLHGVPTMFVAELDLLSKGTVPRTGLENLRTGIAAGSSVPAELMKKLHRELNLTDLTICYGMTETSPVSCMTTTNDPLIKRVDSVGRLLPHVSAKIVDPLDHSKILGIGEKGELAVNGYLVMTGYWGDKARTDEVLIEDENGEMWMHTGDEAEMDQDGYVKITGRIKDLIIRGGENIHPLEIENVLFAHPGVSEVSVVGLPDERHGECVAAFVVIKGGEKPTAQELREWVKMKLSHHLVPKYVFWTNSYPKTASGKIQKFKLRDSGIELAKEGKGLE